MLQRTLARSPSKRWMALAARTVCWACPRCAIYTSNVRIRTHTSSVTIFLVSNEESITSSVQSSVATLAQATWAKVFLWWVVDS